MCERKPTLTNTRHHRLVRLLDTSSNRSHSSVSFTSPECLGEILCEGIRSLAAKLVQTHASGAHPDHGHHAHVEPSVGQVHKPVSAGSDTPYHSRSLVPLNLSLPSRRHNRAAPMVEQPRPKRFSHSRATENGRPLSSIGNRLQPRRLHPDG